MLHSVYWQLKTFRDNLFVPFSRVKHSKTLEGTYDWFPRKISNWLPIYTTKHPRRAKISFTPRRKPEIKYSV